MGIKPSPYNHQVMRGRRHTMLVRSDGFVRQDKSVRSKRQRRKAPAPIVKKHLLYEIEKVVDARNGIYGREYFVKWRGYRSSENMWIGDPPPFFRNSRFYIATTKERDVSVESESGSATDSEEDDTLDSTE